jgi:PE family
VVVQVDPDGLTNHATDLAGSQQAPVTPDCVPPGADPISASAVAVLMGHVGALSTVLEHGGLVSAHAGAMLTQTAYPLQAADIDGGAQLAALIGGAAGGSIPSRPGG